LYADDASCFFSNTPIITGKDAIREYWKAIFVLPGFRLGLKVVKVEASRSSDLAYTHGQYTLTSNDDMGNPIIDMGKYVVVYRKQPDGQWKVIIDIGNSDSPAPEASTE
jgi:ketosteroid isomerase-like protein